jgi:hypothetical protein
LSAIFYTIKLLGAICVGVKTYLPFKGNIRIVVGAKLTDRQSGVFKRLEI